MFFLRYIIVNVLHTGDNKDDDGGIIIIINNSNNNNVRSGRGCTFYVIRRVALASS